MTLTRKTLLALAALGIAGGGFLIGQADAQARHVHIDAAQRDLREARAHLNSAPDVYGGHKARALQLIDGALAELRAAERYR